MTEYYRKLGITMDSHSIRLINDHIDSTGHRTSNDKAYGAHDYLRRTYGDDYFKNYSGRAAGGPGKNEACFLSIPQNIIDNSALAQVIRHMAPRYDVEPFIFKMPPNYYLSWHKDSVRTVGINIPLDELGDSVTVFTEDQIDNDAELVHKKCMNIRRVPYQLGGMYLLDVTKYHCVFNLSNKNRFIIIAIWDSHGDSYKEILSHLHAGGIN